MLFNPWRFVAWRVYHDIKAEWDFAPAPCWTGPSMLQCSARMDRSRDEGMLLRLLYWAQLHRRNLQLQCQQEKPRGRTDGPEAVCLTAAAASCRKGREKEATGGKQWLQMTLRRHSLTHTSVYLCSWQLQFNNCFWIILTSTHCFPCKVCIAL